MLVPLTSLLAVSRGGWQSVFLVAAGMSIAAALLALLVLKPARARMAARAGAEAASFR